MENNPLVQMINTMREQGRVHNPPSVLLGEVLTPPPNLKIRINDIILEREEIWIQDYLLAGYRREAKGHIKSGTQPASCTVTHAHGIDNEYTDDIVYTDTLKKGDIVSVLPMEGGQQYHVLGRVVRL